LSICYGIVREHGGNIRLENVKPHGARVTIELPVAEASLYAPPLAIAVGAPA
jgi:signal transduction histidine kinase